MENNFENEIVDVIYDNMEIVHVLEPNQEGVRGVSINHFMMRDTIKTVEGFFNFKAFDLAKIEDYKNELTLKLNN
ncbi:MAG: hypothetical protein ACOH2D_11545 [Gelidibacter sp.]